MWMQPRVHTAPGWHEEARRAYEAGGITEAEWKYWHGLEREWQRALRLKMTVWKQVVRRAIPTGEKPETREAPSPAKPHMYTRHGFLTLPGWLEEARQSYEEGGLTDSEWQHMHELADLIARRNAFRAAMLKAARQSYEERGMTDSEWQQMLELADSMERRHAFRTAMRAAGMRSSLSSAR